MDRPEKQKGASRRTFLRNTALGVIGTALGGGVPGAAEASVPAGNGLTPVSALPKDTTRTWLGSSFWANRLQDWRLHRGRLECLRGEKTFELRTVALLTRSIEAGNAAGHLRVRTGLLSERGQKGFCGFILGVSGGELDHRAAALVQRASGIGGGFIATLGTDGRIRFREHTSETEPLAFAELPTETNVAGAAIRPDQEVLLDLVIKPQSGGRFDVELTARDASRQNIIAQATRRGVADAELVGGLALVSSPPTDQEGARWWFSDLETDGEKIAEHPERELGPILGTLYSLNGRVLKLSAQLLPVGDAEPWTCTRRTEGPHPQVPQAGDLKICLTQTCFACVQTSPNGRPILDFDSNGYPPLARRRAIELLRDAGALVLAGDQHLATVVRHGIDTYTDGVVQFTGPAGATAWQRWFEPGTPLPNGTGDPHTGDFQDAFGNKLRVLAVANPKLSFAEYRKHIKGRPQRLWDRRLKSEGYGIVRVDHDARAYVLECWPWDEDPKQSAARQFPGWPYRLPFSEVRGVSSSAE